MLDEALNEFHNGNGFFYVFVIFMTIVVKRDKIPIVFINAWSGDNRAAKITTNIFYDVFRIAFVGLCIDIEPFFMFPVAAGLDCFERGADPVFHFIKESGAEGVTKESIVKVMDITPEAIITVSPFRNEAVDVRVPF